MKYLLSPRHKRFLHTHKDTAFIFVLLCAVYGIQVFLSFECDYSAATEDANRAIELKNGSSIGGRKIGVKPATHRAPLEQRRSRGDPGVIVIYVNYSFYHFFFLVVYSFLFVNIQNFKFFLNFFRFKRFDYSC